MKLISTFVFVSAAFVTGCSWGDGSGTDQPPPPQDSSTANVCGDGVCAASEINLCAADCGTPAPDAPVTQCGNFVCDPGEDSSTCPNDCSGGSGSGSGSADCIAICAADFEDPACLECLFGGGGGSGSGSGGFGDGGCTGGAADGTCDATEEANPFNCISDCL